MKKKTVRRIAVVLAAAALLLIVYNTAAAFAVAPEYDGDGGFFGKIAFSLSQLVQSDPATTFKKTAYRFFGAVFSDKVASGRDGYLFPTTSDDFDYKADIAGRAEPDYEGYLQSLQTRKEAMAADGCAYYVFVIPNSQTVMRQKLRQPPKDTLTAAQKLEKYLHENGFDEFYLLDTALQHSKSEPYHNTENAINEYGAYLAYKRIASLMPDAVSRRAREAEITADDVLISYSDGRSLAALADLQKTAKNKNVYYDTAPFTSAYTAKTSGTLTVCELKEEYNGFIGRSDVLLEIPDSYERSLLKPLFSSTYTNTTYKNTLSYSKEAADKGPAVCVCILREDKLDPLLDRADIKTYADRAKGEDKGGKTETPQIVAVSYKGGSAFVAGYCADGSDVTVTSEKQSVTVRSRDGLFIAEVKADKSSHVTVTAKREDRAVSDEAGCRVPASASSDKAVFAGYSSMLCYSETKADYTGSNLLDSVRLAQTRQRAEMLVEKVRRTSGKDTKILFLAAPNPLSVYPDAAPEDLSEKRGSVSRLDQLKTALSGLDGFTFIDVRTVMRENADLGKLYYQTDTHWTELGAYFGYRAIIEAIAEDRPGVSPYSLNSFEAQTVEAASGDLASFAGITAVKEKITVLRPAFTLAAQGLPEKPDTIDRSVYAADLTSHTDGDGLPSAYMIRDSYSANLFPVIGEHFSTLFCQRMWELDPDYKKIEELKPDYVIFVICERNLRYFE